MPGIAPNAGARILQGLELQPAFRQAHPLPVFDQPRSVGRYKMSHLVTLPHVAVEPQSTVHRVYHPGAPLPELDVINRRRRFIHSTT